MLGRHPLRLCAAIAAVLLAVAACSGDSSDYPVIRAGRTLHVTVLALDRLPELRYSQFFQEQPLGHFRVRPSQEGMEIVLARLRVENHTAVTSVVVVDGQAAELRDFFQGAYWPVDLLSQGERWTRSDSGWVWVNNSVVPEVPEDSPDDRLPDPPDWDDGTVRKIELQAGGGAVPGQGFLLGSVQLDKGYGVEGWMVFEAPEGIEFRELRWRAGDSITIEF